MKKKEILVIAVMTRIIPARFEFLNRNTEEKSILYILVWVVLISNESTVHALLT